MSHRGEPAGPPGRGGPGGPAHAATWTPTRPIDVNGVTQTTAEWELAAALAELHAPADLRAELDALDPVPAADLGVRASVIDAIRRAVRWRA